jgi:hypothetical protein
VRGVSVRPSEGSALRLNLSTLSEYLGFAGWADAVSDWTFNACPNDPRVKRV